MKHALRDLPDGDYVTAIYLERQGWNRQQITAAFGLADLRRPIGQFTLSLYDRRRIESALGVKHGADLEPTPEILLHARHKVEETIELLLHAQVQVGHIDDNLLQYLRYDMRYRSGYRSAPQEVKDSTLLARLRHEYTYYDECWNGYFKDIPLAPLAHDAYRVGVHNAIAKECSSMQEIVDVSNTRLESSLQTLKDSISPPGALKPNVVRL